MDDQSAMPKSIYGEWPSLAVALGLLPLIGVLLVAGQERFGLEKGDNEYFLSPAILLIADTAGLTMAVLGLSLAGWTLSRFRRAGERGKGLLLPVLGNALNIVTIVILLIVRR